MCNCSKKCNCNITQITKGEKGDSGLVGAAGTNGTNAFKFVKQFDYDGSTPIEIPYVQITACAPIPEGCFADGTTYDDTVDYHAQLWIFGPPKFPGGNPTWSKFPESNYDYDIDSVTGDVLLTFQLEFPAATYRLVILA